MAKRSKKTEIVQRPEPGYGDLLTGISDLLEQRPADVGPLGQQHPDRDLLGDRPPDRRVRAARPRAGRSTARHYSPNWPPT